VSGDSCGENRDVFEITRGPGEVNAWSEVRLPFQPKGEMLEFRPRLDAAIRAMPPARAGHLAAAYTAADPNTLIDTENILFYNVGLGCFAAHTRRVWRLSASSRRRQTRQRLPAGPGTTTIATA
jgi:hypothetical protein